MVSARFTTWLTDSATGLLERNQVRAARWSMVDAIWTCRRRSAHAIDRRDTRNSTRKCSRSNPVC